LTALFSGIFATAKAVDAEEKADREVTSGEFTEKIYPCLEKSPENRSIEEKIKLFNYLLRAGEREAEKARGKEIVVFFGNTGAGKSTLINYLYGCTMIEADRKIIVDPDSKIKEVADIGGDLSSCTYIPKKIPDVTFYLQPSSENVDRKIQHRFTFYDMPGLSDSRGVEVALANTIALKQIVRDAKSVRFVMVFDHTQLKAEKYVKWKEAVKLLEERFNKTVGGGRSLCVVMTKETDNLATIKKDIRKFADEHPELFDLSDSVSVYTPLDSSRREQTLDTILSTSAFSKLNVEVSMSGDQLWSALQLGTAIQKEVTEILEERSFREIDRAVKMIEFTHGIAKLGNPGLIKPHEEACKGVYELAEHVIGKIETDSILGNKIDEYLRYKKLREKFHHYVNFEKLDYRLKRAINATQDDRFLWHTVDKSIMGSVSCVLVIALALINPLFLVGLVVTAPFTGKALANWWDPSKRDLNADDFFSGEFT